MYLTANEGFLRRTLNHVLFAIAAVFASFRAERPDVVVATSPQFLCGLAGNTIARLKRRPFILEVRDLWPDSIVQLGQLRSRPLIRLLEAVETRLYRSADGIVVNTSAFIDHISARGVPRERVALVYNGIDLTVFRPQPVDRDLLRSHGLEGKFLVAYIGTLGLAHGLLTVVRAAERLRETPDIMFLLIGDGADRDHLAQEIAQRRISNVRLLGLRPRDEIPSWIASVDLALVLLRDLPVFETVIPSKIFEFLGQQRPVVVAARGEIRRLINEAKAGMVIDPENAPQLAAAILEVRARPEEAQARARTGREWVEANFDRDTLARLMADFLARIARVRP